MSNINDGGPAFPLDGPNAPAGMSLRDYFAAQVLPAAYEDCCIEARKRGWQPNWKMGVAIEAYELADAMLKAREVQP